jgi:hypothetical protein
MLRAVKFHELLFGDPAPGWLAEEEPAGLVAKDNTAPM